MRFRLQAAALIIILVTAVCLSAVSVDRSEFVYVTQFGRHITTYDGATDAGLHWRWPWPVQTIARLDRRVQFLDLPATESLTHDSRGQTIDKTLVLGAYLCWRIAPDGVDQFIQTVGTPDRAREILRQRVNSQLGAEVGRMEMDDLASVEPGRVDRGLDQLRQRLLFDGADGSLGLSIQARQSYGIELVDVRLRRFNHPAQVRDDIFRRIRSERDKKVVDYKSEGERQARDIQSTAEREAAGIIAEARADERRLKGQADADADRLRTRAYAQDPEFYVFLKKLEEYQAILGNNRTVLLLSANRELFDLLFAPPGAKSGTGVGSTPAHLAGRPGAVTETKQGIPASAPKPVGPGPTLTGPENSPGGQKPGGP